MSSLSKLAITLWLVFMLSLFPLPLSLALLRPPFILLFVLYVQFVSKHRFPVLGLFLLGLCLDVLTVSVLGEHAFALLLAAWFASSRRRRFYFSSLPQQALFIMMGCAIYATTLCVIDHSMGYASSWISVPLTMLTGVICWPWLRWGLDVKQRVC